MPLPWAWTPGQVQNKQIFPAGDRATFQVSFSNSASYLPRSGSHQVKVKVKDPVYDEIIESPLTSLPQELLCKILSWLDPFDLIACAKCCRELYQVSRTVLFQSIVDTKKELLRIADYLRENAAIDTMDLEYDDEFTLIRDLRLDGGGMSPNHRHMLLQNWEGSVGLLERDGVSLDRCRGSVTIHHLVALFTAVLADLVSLTVEPPLGMVVGGRDGIPWVRHVMTIVRNDFFEAVYTLNHTTTIVRAVLSLQTNPDGTVRMEHSRLQRALGERLARVPQSFWKRAEAWSQSVAVTSVHRDMALILLHLRGLFSLRDSSTAPHSLRAHLDNEKKLRILSSDAARRATNEARRHATSLTP